MELATVTAALDVVSNTTNSLTVRNFTSNSIVLASGVNYELSSQNGTNSAIGTVPVGVTITPSQTLTINVTATPMMPNAFSLGSIFITPVLRSLAVKSNTANEVEVTNNNTMPIDIEAATHMRLYDDDDYNRNNTPATLSGDENEPIVMFNDTLRHLSDNLTSGNFPDASPMNILASSYMLPEYDWAYNVMHYNQSNVVFDTNLEQVESLGYENPWRDSRNDERDSFWIAYFIIAYQGYVANDFDGLRNGVPGTREDTQGGLTLVIGDPCDCLNSSVCPTDRTMCTTLPFGGNTSVIYEESMQDAEKYYSALPPPANYSIKDTQIAMPHELGHQFGLFGDQPGSLFSIMDYPNNNISTAPRVQFHPEHVNLIRHRVKSPGQ